MKKYFFTLILLGITVLTTAQEYSYIWANQYPALAEPTIVCCYVFDNDMTEDDQAGEIMLQLGAFLGEDVQDYPDGLIIDNQWIRVLRWDSLPSGDGPVSLSILQGSIDNESLNLQGRIDGDTEITLDPVALNVFNGSITNGYVDLFAAESEHLFITPLVSVAGSADGSDAMYLLKLNDVRIRGNIIQNTIACDGICSETMNGIDPVLLGAIEVSGLLHHSDELDTQNNAASNCECAGVNSSTPLLDYLEDDTALTISCNYQDLDSKMCDESNPSICQTVENLCNFAAAQPGFYDIDSDGNGVNDSKSVGGLLGFSSTTITGLVNLIFKDGFE